MPIAGTRLLEFPVPEKKKTFKVNDFHLTLWGGLFLIAPRLKAGPIGDQKKPHILRLMSMLELLHFSKHLKGRKP